MMGKIHLGNAGKGAIDCGAREVKEQGKYGIIFKNWSWKSSDVTCKKCLALIRKRRLER